MVAGGADGVEHGREGGVAGEVGDGFVAAEQGEGFGEGGELAVEVAGPVVDGGGGGGGGAADGAPVGVGEDVAGGGVQAEVFEPGLAGLGADPAFLGNTVDAEHGVEEDAEEGQGPGEGQPEEGGIGAAAVAEEVQGDAEEEGDVQDDAEGGGPAEPVPVGGERGQNSRA